MNLAEELIRARIASLKDPRDARARELFKQGKRPSEIGKELGVSKTTIWRWLTGKTQGKRATRG